MNEISEEARKCFEVLEDDRIYRMLKDSAKLEVIQSAIDSATKSKDARIKELEGENNRLTSQLHEVLTLETSEFECACAGPDYECQGCALKRTQTEIKALLHSLEQKGGK